MCELKLLFPVQFREILYIHFSSQTEIQQHLVLLQSQGRRSGPKSGGGEGGRRLGVGMNGEEGVGVFDKEFQSAPVNCKADRLSAFCTSRAKTSAIRTRHDKTTLLVTKGGNGHFRTLQAITYKKILNKLMLYWLHVCICLRLLVWNAGRSHVKKNTICKKVWGGKRPHPPPCPSPSAAYESLLIFRRSSLEQCWYVN